MSKSDEAVTVFVADNHFAAEFWREFARQSAPRPTGACADCMRKYGDEYGFPDLVIPDDVWARISPTGGHAGLLCPSCIVRRCVALGLSNVPAKWMSGPFMEAGDA